MHRATVRKFLNKKEFYKDNLYIKELEFKKILPHVTFNADLSSSFTLTNIDLETLIKSLNPSNPTLPPARSAA